MSNEGVLTTALKVKMIAVLGTAAASCSQLDNVLTCNVFAPDTGGKSSVTLELVVSVRGNINLAELSVGAGFMSHFFGAGLGEVTVEYEAKFESDDPN